MDHLTGETIEDDGMIADLQPDPRHAEMQDPLNVRGVPDPTPPTLEMIITGLFRLGALRVNGQEETSSTMMHSTDNAEMVHRLPQDVMTTAAIYSPLELSLGGVILSPICPRDLLLVGLLRSGLTFRADLSKRPRKL